MLPNLPYFKLQLHAPAARNQSGTLDRQFAKRQRQVEVGVRWRWAQQKQSCAVAQLRCDRNELKVRNQKNFGSIRARTKTTRAARAVLLDVLLRLAKAEASEATG